MKNRLVAAVLIVAVLAAGAAFFLRSRNRQPTGPVRIGAILPLTGPDAATGKGMLNAITMAVDAVNARGGVQGRKVELIPADDASTDATGLAAATKLAADPAVIGVVGHYEMDSYTAAQVPLSEGRVPDVVTGVSIRELSNIGRNAAEFSVLPTGTAQMRASVRYAWESLAARKYAFVREDTSYGRWMLNQFREAVSYFQKKVATGELLLGPGGDATKVIEQLRASPPDYVFFAGSAEAAARFVSQLRGAGLKCHFQAGLRSPSPEFVERARAAGEGALMVFPGLPAQATAEGRAFLEAYAARGFKEPATEYGLPSYAGAQALLEAAGRSFMTRPSVAGALGREELPTALGPLRFHYLGSTYGTIALYEVVKGQWTPIRTVDRAGKLMMFVAK